MAELPDAPWVTATQTQGALPDAPWVPQAPTKNLVERILENPTKDVPGQISIPGIGKPSAIGTLKAIWDGLTLPRDVSQGKIDPLSDEGIQRAAGLAAVGNPASVATKPGTMGLGISRQMTPPDTVTAVATKTPAPTNEMLFAKAGEGYDAARKLGVKMQTAPLKEFGQKLRSELDEMGLDENVAAKTHGILNRTEKVPDDSFVTVQNMESLRRTLGHAAESTEKPERKAAKIAQDSVDEFLSNLPKDAVIEGDAKAASRLLEEARGNHAAASRSAEIDQRLIRAELRASAANSGMNVANTIRQRIADVLTTPRLQRGYSPEELAQMKLIVSGTKTGNTARYAKNIFGGGGGMGTMATEFAGAAMGGPKGLLLAAPGMIGRMITDASTKRQATILSEMIRSRSPLAQQRTFAVPEASSSIGNSSLAKLLANPQTMPLLLQGQRNTNLPTDNSL